MVKCFKKRFWVFDDSFCCVDCATFHEVVELRLEGIVQLLSNA